MTRDFGPGHPLITFYSHIATPGFWPNTQSFLDGLATCEFRINLRDTHIVPTRLMSFLGFELDTKRAVISHTPQRFRSLHETLRLLDIPQPISMYQKLAGLWCFYCLLYRAGYHALRPLFDASVNGHPPPRLWCAVFSRLW